MSWFLDPALQRAHHWSIQLVYVQLTFRRHFGWAFCLCISKFFWLPTTHFKASKATNILEMQMELMECHHTSCYQVGTYCYETDIHTLVAKSHRHLWRKWRVAASSGWVWAAWAMIHGIFEQGFKLLDFPSLWRTEIEEFTACDSPGSGWSAWWF